MTITHENNHEGCLPFNDTDKGFVEALSGLGHLDKISDFKKSDRQTREMIKKFFNVGSDKSIEGKENMIGREITRVSPMGKTHTNHTDITTDDDSTILTASDRGRTLPGESAGRQGDQNKETINGGKKKTDIRVQKLIHNRGGSKIHNVDDPGQGDINCAADLLWRFTKFPQEDDWAFEGKYRKRIAEHLNVPFTKDTWGKWRERLKKQLNRKRTCVTQQVKDEYIGKIGFEEYNNVLNNTNRCVSLLDEP